MAIDPQRNGPTTGQQRLPWLNGLRGIAIAGVVGHHSFFTWFEYGKQETGLPTILVSEMTVGGTQV